MRFVLLARMQTNVLKREYTSYSPVGVTPKPVKFSLVILCFDFKTSATRLTF